MVLDELLKLGASVFQNSRLSGDAGSNLDLGSLVSALSGLTKGSGGLNFADLISKLEVGGLGDIAESWLGNGANLGISPTDLGNIIGADKISEFAGKLGLSDAEAAGGLSEAIPQMIDKASSNGSLLDSIGGVEGVLGLAKKLFS